jgi:molecular chaperone GrpE
MAEKDKTKDDTDTEKKVTDNEAETPSPSASDQLLQELEEVKKSAESFKDLYLRKAAEFENFKRRGEADFLNLIRNANEGLLEALIPIVDDFDRSLKTGTEMKDPASFFRGVELMYSKLMKILEAQGLTPFDSIGKQFDVEYHDALMQTPRSDVPPNTVVEEVEKGYSLNGKVLRHAKVIVSQSHKDSTQESGTMTGNDTTEGTESEE